MWSHPWGMGEGIAIGAGLIVTGLLLQLSIGPVLWELFAWPVNILVVGCWLAAVGCMTLLHNKVYAIRFLGSYAAAIPAMGYAVLLTIVMGLTTQSDSGSWFSNMLRCWPFVLIYTWIVVILSLVVVKGLRLTAYRLRLTTNLSSLFSLLSPLLLHTGLLVALVCGTLGNPDMRRLKMICGYGEAEWRAIDDKNRVVELPLAIELKKFTMEEYAEEGMPKRFASDIQILTRSGKNITATVEVNKPVEVEGWKIYQYGYDQQMGAMSQISIFELVTDPWLPAVYTGIYMMLAGAGCLLFLGGKERRSKEKRGERREERGERKEGGNKV